MTFFTGFDDAGHKRPLSFLLLLVLSKKNYMKKALITLSVFVWFMPLLTVAHPGHGEAEGYTITHYFTQPVHLVVSLVALLAVVAAARYFAKSKQRN